MFPEETEIRCASLVTLLQNCHLLIWCSSAFYLLFLPDQLIHHECSEHSSTVARKTQEELRNLSTDVKTGHHLVGQVKVYIMHHIDPIITISSINNRNRSFETLCCCMADSPSLCSWSVGFCTSGLSEGSLCDKMQVFQEHEQHTYGQPTCHSDHYNSSYVLLI